MSLNNWTPAETDEEFFRNLPDLHKIEKYLDPQFNSLESLMNAPFKPFSPSFDNVLLVQGLPVIDQSKVESLTKALYNSYFSYWNIDMNKNFFMPVHEGTTGGVAFVHFTDPAAVLQASKFLTNEIFAKKYKIIATPYNTFGKIVEGHDDPLNPPEGQFQYFPRPDITSWLADPQNRDQFAIRFHDETHIKWAPSLTSLTSAVNQLNESEIELVYDGSREKSSGKSWCEQTVTWSPRGTYFVTFHAQGVKLWGGPEFAAQHRFMHRDVHSILFSPCEKYLLTLANPEFESIDQDVILWDVRSGKKIKTFNFELANGIGYTVQATIKEAKSTKIIFGQIKSEPKNDVIDIEEGNTLHSSVPISDVITLQNPNKFVWSQDGKYLARSGPGNILVYSADENFALHDQRSIIAKNIIEVAWCPVSKDILTYTCAGSSNIPSTITLMDFPSRKEITSRNYFDVVDIKLAWQNMGEFISFQMKINKKKNESYSLIVFRTKDLVNSKKITSNFNVPVEQIDINKPILDVYWEPNGDRLFLRQGEQRNPEIALYGLSAEVEVKKVIGGSNKGPQTEIKQILNLKCIKTDFNQCHNIIWSPSGRFAVFVNIYSDGANFEFFDADSLKTTSSSRRHLRSTELSWDPSGYYFVSATVTSIRNKQAQAKSEDGLEFFSYSGTPILSIKQSKIFSFQFRPRPPIHLFLTEEERENLKKKYKTYEKQFDAEEKLIKTKLKKDITSQKTIIADNYINWINNNRKRLLEKKALRIALRNGYDHEDSQNYNVEAIQSKTIHKTTETVN